MKSASTTGVTTRTRLEIGSISSNVPATMIKYPKMMKRVGEMRDWGRLLSLCSALAESFNESGM